MNEKIKQLQTEAWDYACSKITPNALGQKNHEDYFAEKFAELIVQQCASAFEAEVDTWKEMDPYQGSIKRQGTKAIKQHFGVEL